MDIRQLAVLPAMAAYEWCKVGDDGAQGRIEGSEESRAGGWLLEPVCAVLYKVEREAEPASGRRREAPEGLG